jgi:hypothetical protein
MLLAITLTIIILGTITLALVVDVVAVLAWLKRR